MTNIIIATAMILIVVQFDNDHDWNTFEVVTACALLIIAYNFTDLMRKVKAVEKVLKKNPPKVNAEMIVEK